MALELDIHESKSICDYCQIYFCFSSSLNFTLSLMFVCFCLQFWGDVPDRQWCWQRHSRQREGEERKFRALDSQPDGHRLSMYKMQSTVAGESFTLHCVYKLHISLAIKTYFHRFVTVGWLVLVGLNPEEASSWVIKHGLLNTKRRQTGYSSMFPSKAFIWQLIFLLRRKKCMCSCCPPPPLFFPQFKFLSLIVL